MAREALPSPRRLNPGRHLVVTRGERGRETSLVVEVGEGQTREVVLALPPGDAPAEHVAPSLAPEPARPRASAGWLVPSGIALGSVGLLLGAVAGLVAAGDASDLRHECPRGECPPDLHDELRRVETFGAIATVGFVAGALGAALTVAGVVLADRRGPSSARYGRLVWVF